MIITILVKRRPDLTFDTTYAKDIHMPIVVKNWGPHGYLGGMIPSLPLFPKKTFLPT